MYFIPKDFGKKLGKNLIFPQIWVETWPSAQFSFQKLDFGNISQKVRKSRYQNFIALV